ncbi:MAG: RNA 2',3'-cyclic phosphodiesterase [Candidatus Atribacteria bacterium]|nr:RNA 2',3'-cyclic phosphodiesterase [Candidatus Atribacteria bacterium]
MSDSIRISNTKRVFIAINLDTEIKEYIAKVQEGIEQLRGSLHGKMKLVEKENLHISLKFLGNLDSMAIEKTKAVLQKVSQQYQPFFIELSENIGMFPNFKRPRVIWIGVEKGSNKIVEIYQALENELKTESFYQTENNFSVHITLARIKYIKNSQKMVDYLKTIEIDNLSQKVQSIDLMESCLTNEGPIYHVLKHFPLLT